VAKPDSQRSSSLNETLAALRKSMPDVPLFVPSVRRYIPMRHAGLARLLGGDTTPGIPTGIWVEIVGEAASGKTSTTFALIDAVVSQPDTPVAARLGGEIVKRRPPRNVLYLDYERTLDLTYLSAAAPNAVLAVVDEKTGRVRNADTANVYVHQPSTAEEGLDIATRLIESGYFGLVIYDSVPAMLPADEASKDSIAANTVGSQARMLGKMFRRMTSLIANMGVTVVLVNQWRSKIGVVFGDPRTTPGGAATAYYDSIKLSISGTHKTPHFELGKLVNIKAMKNKVTGVRDAVTYHLGHGVGLSAEVEMLETALACGVITQSGRTFTIHLPGKPPVKTTDKVSLLAAMAKPKNWAAFTASVMDTPKPAKSLSMTAAGTFGERDYYGSDE